MFSRTLAAELFRLSRNRHLIFWGFLFVPLCALAIGVSLDLLQSHSPLSGMPVPINLFVRLTRAAEISTSLPSQLFLIAAAAVLFGADYNMGTWRLIAPRNRRADIVMARAFAYGLATWVSLLLLGLGGAAGALLRAVLERQSVLWQSPGASPLGAVLMMYGVSWLELLLVGFSTALVVVMSRSVLAATVCVTVLTFAQALLGSLVDISQAHPLLYVSSPVFSAQVVQFFLTERPYALERHLTSGVVFLAGVSLLAWTAILLSFAILWFQKQDLDRE